MPKPIKGGFYAVSEGRTPGVYLTWEECEAQVKGYPNPKFKKFANAVEAENFVKGSTMSAPSTSEAPGKKQSSNTGKAPTYDKGKKRAISPDVEDESAWDVVYSDGACKGNGKAGSIAGVGVWWGPNDPRNIAERCPGDQTNNRAELIAILRILETTPRTKKPLLIKSDSQYSINCFKSWLPGWRRKGWKTSTGEPVKNGGIIRYLSAHLDARARFGQKIRLQYVKGHSGEQGNDGADAQANLGALEPVEPERDWAKLEREFVKQVEEDWQSKKIKPSEAPMEVEGNHVELSTESPMKVRKTGQETQLQQPPRIPNKSLITPTVPAVIPTRELPNLSTLQSAESPRQMSSFKPARVVPPSQKREAAPRAVSKLADPPSPIKVAPSTPKQTSDTSLSTLQSAESPRLISSFKPARVASPSQKREAAPKAVSKLADPPSPVKVAPTPKQTSDTSRSPPSMSKYPQKTQALPPKTPSRIPQPVFPHHGKLSPSLVSPVKPSTARFTASPLRNVHTTTREYSVTPPRSTRTAQVQATPTLISEAQSPIHTPGIPSIVVNKEDIDFTMFEDCALDDEDMWKDLWP